MTPAATVTATELRHIRENDPLVHVIDVRTPGEFETAHIDGSYNVPLDQLAEHAEELAALDHPVVLVCQSGARATRAMEQLASAGKANMRLLSGGIGAWQAADGHVVRRAERWSLERQVRLVAGSIVLVAIVVSVWFPAARFVAGFVGAGLTFAAVTNTCAMAMVLTKLPYNRGASCDVDAIVRQLSTTNA
ncbi:MAG: rhodanese-like domain-containing protein [Acidimicrobiales bacterium]